MPRKTRTLTRKPRLARAKDPMATPTAGELLLFAAAVLLNAYLALILYLDATRPAAIFTTL